MSEYYKPFRESLKENPQNVRDVINAISNGDTKMDSCFIDTILGIPNLQETHGREYLSSDHLSTLDMYSETDFIYEGTSYHTIRKIFEKLEPQQDDIIYDIGSGYGRFCFYGALTTDAKFKGIETVAGRYEKTQNIKKDFDISNVEFINRNVVNVDLSYGNIFYMFNPFYPDGAGTLSSVERMLSVVARKKPITVVTASMRGYFPQALRDSFEKVDEINAGFAPVEFFHSTDMQIASNGKVQSISNKEL